MKKVLKNVKVQILILGLIFLGVGVISIPLSSTNLPKTKHVESNAYTYLSYNTEKFRYLSDTPYIEDQSSVGYGSILLDTNINTSYNNALITLNIDGVKTSFIKGVLAHATSTVVYDVSSYNYDYFTSYIGVDQSAGNNGNGVKFYIYTSVDGQNWDLKTEQNPPVMKGVSNAVSVKIDIRNVKYLKLVSDSLGNQGSDHSVYANAKLIKEDYVEETTKVDFIKTVEEYDRILAGKTPEQMLRDYELTLLQRELVKNAGYDILQMYAQYSDEYRDVLRWLMSDRDNLNLYITGGKPAGSYINSLKVLVELYNTHRDDWAVTEVSSYGNVKGQVYKRMAFALSLTHSAKVALWMQPSAKENQSNALVRYETFKKLYDEGKFRATADIDITKWFESYTVEEMRFVMNTALDDEEVLWLYDYTQSYIDQNPNRAWTYLTPHPYMAYVWPNYANPVFHDPDKKEYWDQKYNGIFSKYGVTYSTEGNMVYKVWMNFRTEFNTGAVCGGISKTGSNIRAVHGIAAAVIGQPGHAAIIYYTENADGKGYWGIDNDVSGWTLSEKGERMLLGWGNDRRYVKGYNVPYIIMAQEALNRFEDYEKSAKLVMAADVYATNKAVKEQYLREAIKALDFNVDAWYELIDLYLNDETKTEEEIYNLASEMSEALLEFPLPFYNLMEKIEPKLTSNAYKFKFSLLLTDTLNKGKEYNGTEVLQPSVTRLLASYLLGKVDSSLATFSFDGENSESIVLSDRFDGSGIRWDYSLDGKQTWNEVSFTAEEEHKLKLTPEEIAKITTENDIYVHIVGVNYNDENLYKIDIQQAVISATLFNNDLENRVIGVNETYEWRMKETDPWNSYRDSEPDLTGDKTVQVRVGATGIYLPSEEVTYSFTQDNQPDTRKYVSIDHLAIHKVSTEATAQKRHATNAIDGNYNTNWHSAWNGTDTERYIIIKLDEPRYISSVEFVPAGGGNGKIYDGTVYGSMDGENFEVLTSKKNLTYTNQANTVAEAIANIKDFDIGEPKRVQYIKIVADRTNGNWITARAFNFFEDTTIKILPEVSVQYSITTATNQNVVARLICSNSEITILNNNGSDVYEFVENGTFTFEYRDIYGIDRTLTAAVNWIDREVPTASIKYDRTTKGSKPVVATLVSDKESITILNNNGSNTYTFTKNGTFEFIYQDAAGNQNKAIASVDWIIPEQNNVSKNPVNSSDVKKPSNSNSSDNSVVDNTQVEYRTHFTDTVSIMLPVDTLKELGSLKENTLELSSSLQDSVGKDSKYFEVYFDKEATGKETLDTETFEMLLKIDPTKKLSAIYEVGPNDSLKSLRYIRVGENQVSVEVTGLKKYIIAYEDEKEQEKEDISEDLNHSQNIGNSSDDSVTPSEKESIQLSSNLHFWLVGGVSVLLIGLGVYLLKRKSDAPGHFMEVN